MKSLQDRLKELESAGMILTTRSKTSTPRTEHEITQRGTKLLLILLDLKALAEESTGVLCHCPIENSSEGNCPLQAHHK